MKKVILFLITFLIILNVKADNLSIVYLSLDGGEKILISNEYNYEPQIYTPTSGSYKNVTIKDYEVYKNVFMINEEDSYPKYILETTEGYSFSDFKKSDLAIKNTFVVSTKFYSFFGTDTKVNISSCEDLLGYNLINLIKNNVFKMIYYLVPIIFIIMSSFDFAKLVFTSDKEGLNGAFNKFIKRVVASVLIFLVPTILLFCVNIFGSEEIKSCITTFETTSNLEN